MDAPNLFSQAKLPDFPTTPFITGFEIFLELSRCHDVLKPAHSLYRPSLSPAPTKPTHAEGLSCPHPALDCKEQAVSRGNLGNASEVVEKLRSYPPPQPCPDPLGEGPEFSVPPAIMIIADAWHKPLSPQKGCDFFLTRVLKGSDSVSQSRIVAVRKRKRSRINKSSDCFPTLGSAESIRVWNPPPAALLSLYAAHSPVTLSRASRAELQDRAWLQSWNRAVTGSDVGVSRDTVMSHSPGS